MTQPDLDPTPGIAPRTPHTVVISQPTQHDPFAWQRRPTNPIRVPIVTVFCACDTEVPPPSYMPRLPGRPEPTSGQSQGLGSRCRQPSTTRSAGSASWGAFATVE